MLINNIDISNFKTILLKKDIQTVEVTIYDDWLRQSLNPLYLGKKEQYKQIKVQFFIKDVDEESTLLNISNLIKQLEKCTVKFDDLNFYYDCVIANKNNERKVKGMYILDVELKGYAYKPTILEVMSHVITKTINVVGNQDTPATLEITPNINLMSIKISGLGEDIVINNLTSSQTVIINGEDCTITQNGINKFPDTDMWEYPILKPGSNIITIDNSNCTINIKYKPRWI